MRVPQHQSLYMDPVSWINFPKGKHQHWQWLIYICFYFNDLSSDLIPGLDTAETQLIDTSGWVGRILNVG